MKRQHTDGFLDLVEGVSPGVYELATHADGPAGELPLTERLLRESPSGDIFALTQNAGMGWDPSRVLAKPFLILSTRGGLREPDGRPIALGYHTGHWEIGLLVEAAARELRALGHLPHAAYVSDPCDGRTQGTPGMMDSLPYRNDAAVVMRRLIRSLPTARGVLGVATCDKGLPAMLLALAAQTGLPTVVVPGGVTLPPTSGEDAGRVQSIGTRFAHGELSLEEAAQVGCRACGTPGGGCQFLGTAATSQVVAEALGLALPHSALAPSGAEVWLDMGRRSGRALSQMEGSGLTTGDILSQDAIRNAMVLHAAFGGSTNLLLHLPAVAHAAGLERPTVADWIDVNKKTPRLVDVLPNGPVGHTTVRAFLAGGVPEVMLHLRELGLLHLDAKTITGASVGDVLDWWKGCERRTRFRDLLRELDGVEPDDVIMSPDGARKKGLTSTVTFPTGNLAPDGSVIKSTAIDPSVVDSDGVYRKVGPARVYTRERDAIEAIKSKEDDRVQPGDVLVLICRGPMGAGMEEIFQITSALRYLSFGKHIAVITDARFSGVSTGACIGHVGPEALAGGPIGKVRDGDRIRIEVDTKNLVGSIDLVGDASDDSGTEWTREAGTAALAARESRPDLTPDPDLPDDTRLWAALQAVSGGTWGGCVYDVDAVIRALGR